MEISLIGKKVHVPKLVSDWLDFDHAFSAKVMAGDWKNMRKDEILYGSTQLVVAIAVAACGLVDRGPSKPPELPVVQPRIGLINEGIAAGSPASLKKLSDVKSNSGISSCVPQLINVESSSGAEELGICRVNNNGVEGSVIVSRDTDGRAVIINKPLVGYRQSDGRIIVGYQRSDVPTDVSQVMVIYSDGSSEYVYANGLKVEFDAKETSGAELLVNLIGKLIEPGGVAAAAEIDTPTSTATVTASAVPATSTKEAPTLVLTERPSVHVDNYMGVQGWSAKITTVTNIDKTDEILRKWKEDPSSRPPHDVFVNDLGVIKDETGVSGAVSIQVAELTGYRYETVLVTDADGKQLKGDQLFMKVSFMLGGQMRASELVVRGWLMGKDTSNKFFRVPLSESEFTDRYKIGDLIDITVFYIPHGTKVDIDSYINAFSKGDEGNRDKYVLAVGESDRPLDFPNFKYLFSKGGNALENFDLVIGEIAHR